MTAPALLCSLCLFSRLAPDEAVTVLNGQAVCADHLGYVQGGEHALALATLNRENRS